MVTIINKLGETIVYLCRNLIPDISHQPVRGLILANCGFGKQAAPAGKFVNDTCRKKNGKVIAKLGVDVSAEFTISTQDAFFPYRHGRRWRK